MFIENPRDVGHICDFNCKYGTLNSRDLCWYTVFARSEVNAVEKATSLYLSLSAAVKSSIRKRCRNEASVDVYKQLVEQVGRLFPDYGWLYIRQHPAIRLMSRDDA